MTYLELFADAADRWRWRAVAGNGEIIAQSEAYASRSSAKRGAFRAFPHGVLR
jgi:uncharacterized protein